MSKPMVEQSALRKILKLKNTAAETRALLRDLEASIAEAEHDVSVLLEADAKVEKGELGAAIAVEKGSCRPPWKDVFLEHMTAIHDLAAKAAEEEIRAKYPPEDKQRLVIYDT